MLLVNLAVAIAKTTWGALSHSISMEADGVHSFLDAASNVTGFIGVWVASHPPDREHPYGHHKFETLASFCISVFLFLGCYEVLQSSYLRFQNNHMVTVSATSFVIMLITVGVNIVLSRWEKNQGETLRSEVLISDSLHTQSDVFVSISVIASLIAGKLGLPIVDPVVAIFIAGIIGKVGWGILLETSRVFTDSARIEADKIAALALSVPGIKKCHGIRTRGGRYHVQVDLNIRVAPQTPLVTAHKLGHQVESQIMQTFSEVVEVIVHMEPDEPLESKPG